MDESRVGVAVAQLGSEPAGVGDEQRADDRRIGTEAAVERGGDARAPPGESTRSLEHSQLRLPQQQAAVAPCRLGAIDRDAAAGGGGSSAHREGDAHAASTRAAQFGAHKAPRLGRGQQRHLPTRRARRALEARRVSEADLRSALQRRGAEQQ